ncbi:MAG TPA: hypothetical protein VLB76_09295 [Thermoanaerobaculia bacterium]|jgi:hypothetical protein|nr:hypothetical protein [Thermoanaerobaculia bacterium]
MVPDIRRAYNADFTQQRYEDMVRDLERDAGCPSIFRICETPLFLSERLTRELIAASDEVLGFVTSEEYLKQSDRAVPPHLRVPGDEGHTVFFQVDFAIVRGEDGELTPRLIELQGFPSLYGFQWLLEKEFRSHFPAVPDGWSPYFSGLTAETYPAALRDVIVADCDPEQAVLLEIDPAHQKTRIDFCVTEQLLGIPVVDAREVIERGGRLFYPRDGREVPIRRIYNRVIFDELERKGIDLSRIFHRDLVDVTWVGHPNWYLKISKFSLPFIKSRYCPPTWFVSDLKEYPEDLESYVLKPLFSFAGLGVELGPTRERLRSLPDPENFILQRRVDYAPALETPDEPAKAEVRMMFVWKDRPMLVNNLVRISKGKMMGVDFNKDKTWIGASSAYHPPLG